MIADLFPKAISDHIKPTNEMQENLGYAAKLWGMNQIGDEIMKSVFKSKATKVQERLAELELRRRALELGMSPQDAMNGMALRDEKKSTPTLITVMAGIHATPKVIAGADSFMKTIYKNAPAPIQAAVAENIPTQVKNAAAVVPKMSTSFTFPKNAGKLGFLRRIL